MRHPLDKPGPPAHMPTEPLLDTCTTREAAALLGVSLRTAQLWVEEGALRAWKTPGGHRRILRSSVEALVRSRGANLPHAVYEILAVEDEPILCRLYEARLGALPGSRLRIAGNGYEGLMRIGEQRPDLLITDLLMPGMDGFELLRRLHRMPGLSTMRVVVVTSLDDEEIAARGGLPDGVALFHKPVSLPQLLQLVSAYRELAGQAIAAP